MLNTWLDCNERDPCPYSQFKVIDLREAADLSPEVRSHLQYLLQVARYGPKFLADMANHLGWEGVKDLIVKREIPTLPTAKANERDEEDFKYYLIRMQDVEPVKSALFQPTTTILWTEMLLQFIYLIRKWVTSRAR